MTRIDYLPTEMVLDIGERASSCRAIAALARTNRHFYNILNPLLYQRNATRDHPAKSCLLWAAKTGCLETIKLGHLHGADLNVNGMTHHDWQTTVTEVEEDEPFMATPLHIATHHNKLKTVEYLLKNNASHEQYSQNVCDYDRGKLFCPLHEAFYHCPDDAAAELLIEHGAYLEGSDSPALHVAAKLNKLHLFKALLKVPQVKAGGRDQLGKTVLHYAAGGGHEEMVKLLLARPEVNPGAICSELYTPLHLAARSRQLSVIKLLLERPEAAINREDAAPQSALQLAFSHIKSSPVSLQVIEALVGRPEPNSTMYKRRCSEALFLAAARARPDVVRFLLDQTDVEASLKDGFGDTSLHAAVRSKNFSMVRFLLRQPGSDVNMPGRAGKTALHLAIEASRSVLNELIDAGADVNKPGPLGTPLRHAVLKHNDYAVETLIDSGADPLVDGSIIDDGLNHLYFCFRPDRELKYLTPLRMIVQCLTDNEADFDTVSKMTTAESPPQPLETWKSDGTPLFFAAVSKKGLNFMRLLLEAGARADSTVYDRLRGEHQSFLAGLFRHEFGVYPFDQETMEDIVGDDADELRDRVRLLLRYGARLDAKSGQSALEYACEVAYQYEYRHDLLWLLLWNSSSRNVSLGHVEDVMREYASRSSANILDDEIAENSVMIVERLTRFIDREL